jgi:hypothetical protein
MYCFVFFVIPFLNLSYVCTKKYFEDPFSVKQEMFAVTFTIVTGLLAFASLISRLVDHFYTIAQEEAVPAVAQPVLNGH